MADDPSIKKCKGCKENLPVSEFWRCTPGHGTSGLFGKCKTCTRKQREARLAAKGVVLPPPNAVSICKRCGRTLHLSMFYKQPHCTNGHWRCCKDCISKYRKQKYRREGPPQSSRFWRKYKYRAFVEGSYEKMLAQQNGRCAICGRLPRKNSLHLDHDHETGKIRGLLCTTCNMGLGSFRDNASLLRAAIRYLRASTKEALKNKPIGLFD